MIIDCIFDFLVSLIPRPVKRFICVQLEKHLHNRAVIRNIRNVLFLLISVVTIFSAVSFVGLVIMLGMAVFAPM